jgi:hypothetical protein
MENFLNKFKHTFNYGDHVITHKNIHGIITGIRVYHSHHFRPDAYMVDYYIDPSPEYESDDGFWEGEVSLKKYFELGVNKEENLPYVPNYDAFKDSDDYPGEIGWNNGEFYKD